MNVLKLKLNPYMDFNFASLDDKPLSPYSELSNYLKEPFLKWAGKLLDAAENEINDDYALVVIGEAFEAKLLQDMQNNFDACQEYRTGEFDIPYSVSERYGFVQELIQKYKIPLSDCYRRVEALLQKYGISFWPDQCKICVYLDVPVSLDEDATISSSLDDAFLIITENRELAQNVANKEGAAIVVLISNRSAASNIGDMKYQWEIEANRFHEVLACIIDRFVKIPFIVGSTAALKDQIKELDEVDYEKLALATEIDTFLTVQNIGDIDVGDSAPLKIMTIPDGRSVPALRVVSSNPGIISADGMQLTAHAPGSVVVEVYRADEIIPFAKKKVSAYRNHFVQSIYLDVETPEMGIGRTQRVVASLIPNDAEDTHSVVWSVNDSALASIDELGNMEALSAGLVTVTASTTRSKGSVEIEVLPNITAIHASVTHSNLYVGQTQPITVSIAPSNCFDPTYAWKSSDKSVAKIEELADGTSVIRATGIGDCTLTCVAKEGGCSTACAVHVESTFKKRENMHGMFSASFISLIAVIFCVVFSFHNGVIGAAAATIVFGVMAIWQNKSDRFWAGVFVMVAVMILLKSFGLINIFNVITMG